MTDGGIQDGAARAVVVVAGAGSLVAGIVGLAVGWPTLGWIALFVLAAALLWAGLLGKAFGGATATYGDASLTILAKAELHLDDPTAAAVGASGLGDLAGTYAFVHARLKDPEHHDAKVFLQDALVEEAASRSFSKPPTADQMEVMTSSASPVIRVLALGVLHQYQRLATPDVLLRSIDSSLSANEQFHALKLTASLIHGFEPAEQVALRDAAQRAETGLAEGDGDRLACIAQILGEEEPA